MINFKSGRFRGIPLISLCLLWTFISFTPTYHLPPFSLEIAQWTIPLVKYSFLFPIFFLAGAIAFQKRKVEFQFWDAVIGAYFLISFLSLWGSELPGKGFAKATYHVMTALGVFFLAQRAFHDFRQVRIFIEFSVGIATIVAIYGIYEFLTNSNPIFGDFYVNYNRYYNGPDRASSSLGNPVVLGTYLVICLPFAMGQIREPGKSKWVHRRRGFSLGILCLALVFTQTRGAWFAAMLIFFSYWKIGKDPYKGKNWLEWVLVCVLIFLFLQPFFNLSVDIWNIHWVKRILLERIENIAILDQAKVYRFEQYKIVFSILKENPLLGLGFGQYTSLLGEYKTSSLPDIGVRTTDNMYLMILAETGTAGISAFLVFFGGIFKHIWENSPEKISGNWPAICQAFLFGFLAHMLFWDGLNHPNIRIGFWIMMGVVVFVMKNGKSQVAESQFLLRCEAKG
jgi:O-antigen ligase